MRFVSKLLVVVLGGLASLVPASSAAAAWWNTESTRVSVYDFNIHKMDDRWDLWVGWIDRQNVPKPDILLLQDMENPTERKRFQAYLGEVWGGKWNGRGSVQGGKGWHAAIVWRTARFSDAKSRDWWGFGDPPSAGSDCVDAADGSSADEPNGAPAVQVRLYDKVAQAHVSAVSFKTPGASPDSCPWQNTRKVNQKLNEYGWSGDILVMGTDSNSRDWDSGAWRDWYCGTNGDIPADDPNTTVDESGGCSNSGYESQGFRDPIYRLCGGDPECLDPEHDTRSRSRIDFILAKLGDGTMPKTSHEDTVKQGSRRHVFSDHRAIRSMIYY